MAETPSHKIRVRDELWEQVQDKVWRLRDPAISASSVCVDALERFVAETDAETVARFARVRA